MSDDVERAVERFTKGFEAAAELVHAMRADPVGCLTEQLHLSGLLDVLSDIEILSALAPTPPDPELLERDPDAAVAALEEWRAKMSTVPVLLQALARAREERREAGADG